MVLLLCLDEASSLTLTPWLFIANKFRHAVRGEKELVSD